MIQLYTFSLVSNDKQMALPKRNNISIKYYYLVDQSFYENKINKIKQIQFILFSKEHKTF